MTPGKTRILVVDDEPALCELIETVLGSAGMDVKALTESTRAVDLLKKEKFDAVFLDVRMPAPNGIDLAKQMRTGGFNQKTPVVMITGDADPGLLKRGFEAGVNFFLFKPVDRRGLLRLVRATQGSIQHEKRRFQRVPVSCKIALEHKGQKLEGSTVDLSLNGMLVEAGDIFAAGTRPDITINLPSGPPLRLKGSVVRAAGTRMGVVLDGMGTGESSRLQDFLLPLILAAMEREAADMTV